MVPNGAMGSYWNLDIRVEEIYKFVSLHVEYCVSFRETFLVCCIFSFTVMWFELFFLNVNAAKKDLFFTCLKRKKTQNVSFAISVYYMDESVLLGTKPLVDSIRHSIRDPSGVFSV